MVIIGASSKVKRIVISLILILFVCFPAEKIELPDYDKEYEIRHLARIIHAECSICPTDEQYMVGSVVLNRIKHEKFPDSLLGVLSQPNQFNAYNTSNYIVSESTLTVAKNLIKGVGRDYTVLFFFRPDAPNKKFLKKMEDNLVFRGKFHNFAKIK